MAMVDMVFLVFTAFPYLPYGRMEAEFASEDFLFLLSGSGGGRYFSAPRIKSPRFSFASAFVMIMLGTHKPQQACQKQVTLTN